MSVSSSTGKVSYNGNGTTVAFSVPFLFLANADLIVTSTVIATGVDTVKTLTTDYTVTGATVGSGTLTMGTAPATGTRLTIQRSTPKTQTTDYVADDAFNPETVELNFDKLTILVQELAETVSRSISFPATDAAPTGVLPSSVARANLFLGFDASGNVSIGEGDSAASAASAAESAASAATASTQASNAASSATSALGYANAAAVSAAAASAIAAGVLTTKGDLVGYGTTLARLAVGSDTQVLTADSTQTLGIKWATPFITPLTTEGDLMYRNATVDTRLAKGTGLQQLRMNAGATAPEWFTGTGSTKNLVVVSDTQATNASAQSLSSGVNTCRINTLNTDTGSIASLGSNQLTLPAGSYRFYGWVAAGSGIFAGVTLETAANTILATGFGMTGVANHSQTLQIQGRFTLVGSTALEVRIRASASGAQGAPINQSGMGEVYLQFSFEQE